MVLSFEGISHVLLDIEGTTCPVSFVSNTLFPYASAHLGDYLERHGSDPAVQALVKEVRMLWQEDPDPEARALLQSGADKRSQTEPEERTRPQDLHERQRLRMPLPAVEPYLQGLIRRDRKVTALKDQQGRIWQEGYTNGELQ
jgi:enolase-phosphatase E1